MGLHSGPAGQRDERHRLAGYRAGAHADALGNIVVMNNLLAHKAEIVRLAIE